jgi:hypothetical protein
VVVPVVEPVVLVPVPVPEPLLMVSPAVVEVEPDCDRLRIE